MSTRQGAGHGPLVFLAVAVVVGIMFAVMYGPQSPLRGYGPARELYLVGVMVPILAIVATVLYYWLTR